MVRGGLRHVRKYLSLRSGEDAQRESQARHPPARLPRITCLGFVSGGCRGGARSSVFRRPSAAIAALGGRGGLYAVVIADRLKTEPPRDLSRKIAHDCPPCANGRDGVSISKRHAPGRVRSPWRLSACLWARFARPVRAFYRAEAALPPRSRSALARLLPAAAAPLLPPFVVPFVEATATGRFRLKLKMRS